MRGPLRDTSPAAVLLAGVQSIVVLGQRCAPQRTHRSTCRLPRPHDDAQRRPGVIGAAVHAATRAAPRPADLPSAAGLGVAQFQEPLDRGLLMIEPLAQPPSMRRRDLEEVLDAAFRVVS